ncbi:MAG: VanW family protein [Thermomicrobiales bacterium]
MDATTTELRHDRTRPPRRALHALIASPWRIIALTFGVGAIVTLLLALLGAAVYTHLYADRIYQGVTVAGVNVGGLTRAEAQARLDDQTEAYQAATLGVGVKPGERRWTVTPADLGVRFDTTAAVDRALAVGRGAGAFRNAADWFGVIWLGRDFALPATLDDAQLDVALRRWAPDVSTQPTNAVFSVAQDGKVTIIGDKSGLGLELAGSRAAFLAAAAQLSSQPVRLAEAPAPAPITAQMLQNIEGQAQAILSQPLHVTYNNKAWSLPVPDLATAFGYRIEDGHLIIALDPNRLGPFLDQVANGVATPGVNAKLVVDASQHYQIQPDKPGVVLDRDGTLAAINAALTAGQHEVAVKTGPREMPIRTADLEPVRARLEKILSTPLTITYASTPIHAFGRPDLLPLIQLTETPDKPEKVTITLDQAKVHDLSTFIAGLLNQPVRDAQFAYINGQVQDKVSSQEGREVQFDKTDQAIAQAILNAAGGAPADVTVTKPKVTSADKASIVVPDKLGYGQTPYGYSIPSRKHNVELAVQRLNGALIPPGAVFSFNAQVGAQTVENGYQAAFGIALVAGKNGGAAQAATVSSVGGGICQVATTLFQGVFKSGMPIEERNWHLYWPVHYGPPYTDTGMMGLDATVDDQSGLDFKFRNITGGWIAIQAVADGENVMIAEYGKNPGWTVTIDPTAITDVKKADPTKVITKTHDLPPGQTLQVSEATDGFSAAIHRRVTDASGKVVTFKEDDGTTLDLDTTFKSTYMPSANEWQVGVPASEPIGNGQ